jgi:two-component system sensor histidine kinase/response regulator
MLSKGYHFHLSAALAAGLRRAVWGLLVLALLGGQAAALESVTLQLKWRHQFQFAGYYAARELGYYADAGLDVTIVEGLPGVHSAEVVISGKAHYGVGMPSLLVERSNGLPVVVLAAIFQHSPETFIALEESGILHPADLKGKRLAIAPHSTPSLVAMLKAESISPGEYTEVPLRFDVGQLVSGDVDALAAYITDEPFQLLKAGRTFHLVRPMGSGIDFYGDCLFTSEEEITHNRERAVRFREASLKGWSYALSHREEVVEIIEEKYGSMMSHEHLLYEANAMQQLILPDLIDIGSMSVQRWERIRDTFADLGQVRDDFDVEPLLFDADPKVPLERFRRVITGSLLIGAVLASLLVWVFLLMMRRRQEAIETQTILDTTVQAIITADERGIIYAANRRAGLMFGYDPGEMSGMRLESLFAEESREQHQGFILKILRGEDYGGFLGTGGELQARRRGGEIFPAHLSLGHSYAGVRHRFVAVIDDLTERKRFERELAESDLRLRFVINNMHSVFFIKDRDGRHVMVNTFYEKATGYSVAQVLGKRDDEFFPPEVGREIIAIDRDVMNRRLQQRFEESVPHPDGTIHTYITEKLPLVDAEGEVHGLVGLATDITERKQMEMALRANEERLDLALRGANLGLWDWQVDTGEQVVNDIWIEMLGYTRAELEESLGTRQERWATLVHPDDMPAIQESLHLHSHGKQPMYRAEFRMRTRSGDWKWILSTGRVIERGEGGEPRRIVGIHMDIDDFKRLQLELEQAREAAESADRAKSRFLANMSHEIRTPMNAVLNLAELLLDSQLDSRQHQYLRVIHTSAKSLLKLINDVLDLSKVEAGRMEIESIPFHLREMMEDLSLTFGDQAARRGIELSIQIAPDVPAMLEGDMYRLRQILVNLIGNAIKFTERGEVTVFMASERVSADSGGERVMVKFKVRDSGIGLTQEQHSRLFEAFSQADSSTTRRFGGTGLGLAISKRLVEHLGGRGIEVDSQPGCGSTFSFAVPFGVAPEPVDPHADKLQGLRVLLVEDSPGARSAYVSMLNRFGAETHCVSGAHAAVELFDGAEQNFDLLLVDWHLPGGDAPGLIERIRKQPSSQPLPVVALVGLASPAEIDRMGEMGVTTLLRKPVSAGALFGAIAELMGVAPQGGPPEEQQSPTPPDNSHEGVRVLLVEDNRVNQLVAQEMLKRRGFQIFVAENGRLALERLEQEAYDLVLMDVQMPVMDGLEATRHIRASEEHARREGKPGRHMPIIAMTANAMSGDERTCLDAGMDAYVAKPLNMQQLMDAISRHVPPRTA